MMKHQIIEITKAFTAGNDKLLRDGIAMGI